MKIGIPKEILTNETRVAAIPSTIKQYINAGFEVFVESKTGIKSLISDNDYSNAGAKIVNKASDIFSNCDIILKVNSPTNDELRMLKDGSIYISFFQTMKEIDKVKHFQNKKITGFPCI
mgnify:FL=1